MNLEFIRMVMLSVKRRRRGMWKVALISFLCVFLFVGIMVFQDCMNQFQREIAFLESGEWIVSTEGESRCLEEHAWVDGYGTTLVRTSLCNEPKDGNMDHAREEGPVGVVDDSFLQLSNIVFYAGKMPEQGDEIALTQQVLSDMGCSYELDQMLSLAYIKGFDDMGNPIYGHIRYKLVGILENYTADWVLPGELPEFFVTMEGLEQIHVPEKDQQRCYYYLNRAQRDITGERFYRDMREVLKKQGPLIDIKRCVLDGADRVLALTEGNVHIFQGQKDLSAGTLVNGTMLRQPGTADRFFVFLLQCSHFLSSPPKY